MGLCLEEAKLLLEDLLALCQDNGMMVDCRAHVEINALDSHTGHMAEAEQHESAAQQLLNQHRRGWCWLVRRVMKDLKKLLLGKVGFNMLTKAHLHAPLGRMDVALAALRRMCELRGHCDLNSIEGFGGLQKVRQTEYSELKEALDQNEQQWCMNLAVGGVCLVILISFLWGNIFLSCHSTKWITSPTLS